MKNLIAWLVAIFVFTGAISQARGQNNITKETLEKDSQKITKIHSELVNSILNFRQRKKEVVFEELYQESKKRPDNEYGNLNTMYLLSWAFLVKEDTKKTIEIFAKMADLYPDSADIHFAFGNLYAFSSKSNYDLAIQEYAATISLQPGYVEAYINKAALQFVKAVAKIDAKLQVSFSVQRMWPEETEAELKEALALLDKTLTLNPDTRKLFCIHFNRGVILNTLFKEKEAVDAFSKAIATGGLPYKEPRVNSLSLLSEKECAYINGDIPVCFFSKAYLYWLNKMSPAAGPKGEKLHTLAQEIYVAGENDPLAFAFLKRGIAYSRPPLKDYPHALEDAKQAIKLNPTLKSANMFEAIISTAIEKKWVK